MYSARRFLCQSGGVRLAPQARSERHLNGREREEISRGIAAGESARQLAKRLGRSPSTVSREIARNGGRDRYRAATADAAAYGRGGRPKLPGVCRCRRSTASFSDRVWHGQPGSSRRIHRRRAPW
ncbi:helix-turn-helix domain-containing protein [Streptomyces sp. NPDC020403]|uniref:helix-turn-helix domain-containing protein n=1 Tax=Streptomyces sp. NPDC020403 TaxID=3154487 RepID=UPI0033FD28E2